mgnify:FL=1
MTAEEVCAKPIAPVLHSVRSPESDWTHGDVVSDIATNRISGQRTELYWNYFKEEHHEELYGKPINN